MATAINVPRYTRRIEAAGLPRAQAEAIAEGAAEELESGFEPRLERIEGRLERIEATLGELRTGIAELRGELRTGLTELRGELRTTDANLRGEIARATNDVLKWLIPLLLTLLVAMLAQASATVFLLLRTLGMLPG